MVFQKPNLKISKNAKKTMLNVGDVTQYQEAWDSYWRQQNTTTRLYGRIASFYRRRIIAPSLRRTLAKFTTFDSSILHAGSGGGEIDILMPRNWKLTAIDISLEALQKHRSTFSGEGRTDFALQADLFCLPFESDQFDVAFNLGVMEHFNDSEIIRALKELRRVAKSDGHVVLYWPPAWGPSVVVLHSVAHLMRVFGRSQVSLHPPEINLFRSKKKCTGLLAIAGLRAVKYSYGPGDFFTHMIVIARPS